MNLSARVLTPPPRPGVLQLLEGVLTHASMSGGASRLAFLRADLGRELTELDVSLSELGVKNGSLAERAAAQLLRSPGKRLRPLCVFLASRVGEPSSRAGVQKLALACELTHAATLLHDDVIDQADLRRGAPSSRAVFGNAASVLGGDFLLLRALRLVQESGYSELLPSLLDAIDAMVYAEALQLEQQRTREVDLARCEEVIAGKTAALFRWALHAGATAGGLEPGLATAIAEAGAGMGRAFQLVDDVLDLSGNPEQTGKALAGDLIEGKMSYPVALACIRDPELKSALDTARGDANACAALVPRIAESGAIEATQTEARRSASEALQALEALPGCAAKRALISIPTLIVERVK